MFAARSPLDFDDVYARFRRTAHGTVLARVGHGDVDDVTQEVFVTVHARLHEVRDPAALPAWIATIARNAAVDHLRRRARRPARNGQALDELPARETVADREFGERVLALIRALPDAYRDTLILRLVEGMTGPEIAERTGLTHGSVRVNLCRGMALLHNHRHA